MMPYPQPTGHARRSNIPNDEQRVKKACDRCAMRKKRCDESRPCMQCRNADLICTSRRTKKKKMRTTVPTGYVEFLEEQNASLQAALRSSCEVFREDGHKCSGPPNESSRTLPIHELATSFDAPTRQYPISGQRPQDLNFKNQSKVESMRDYECEILAPRPRNPNVFNFSQSAVERMNQSQKHNSLLADINSSSNETLSSIEAWQMQVLQARTEGMELHTEGSSNCFEPFLTEDARRSGWTGDFSLFSSHEDVFGM